MVVGLRTDLSESSLLVRWLRVGCGGDGGGGRGREGMRLCWGGVGQFRY
jgi:hypothetical protein